MHALVQSWGEEQQVGADQQLVHGPRRLGLKEPGVETGVLQKPREGEPDHRVGAEDGYGCGLLKVVLHFSGGSLGERASGAGPWKAAEGAGAVTPRPSRCCGLLYLL